MLAVGAPDARGCHCLADRCRLEGRPGSVQPGQGLHLRPHRLRQVALYGVYLQSAMDDWASNIVVGCADPRRGCQRLLEVRDRHRPGPVRCQSGDVAAFQSALVAACAAFWSLQVALLCQVESAGGSAYARSLIIPVSRAGLPCQTQDKRPLSFNPADFALHSGRVDFHLRLHRLVGARLV
ncbi:MAG: hypothetical protein MZV64_60630 [Ignavibacteriales bacterium]|nr:hypothetical protein [Ignavibacteriales bacterium]